MATVSTKLDFLPEKVQARHSEHRSNARRHLADYITAAVLFGDTVSIVCGLLMGFWIRFDSGWITFGVPSSPRPLSGYFGLFGVGLFFFYCTFFYLGFYESRTVFRDRTVFRFRTAALVIAKGTVVWVLAYLGTSLVLKFDPPISRIYALCSFLCTFGFLMVWRGILSRTLHSTNLAKELCHRILIVGWTGDGGGLVAAPGAKRPADRAPGVLGVSSAPDSGT